MITGWYTDLTSNRSRHHILGIQRGGFPGNELDAGSAIKRFE